MEMPIKIKTHDKFATICHPDCPFLQDGLPVYKCLLFSANLSESKTVSTLGDIRQRDWSMGK